MYKMYFDQIPSISSVRTFLFCFFGGTGDWTQGLEFARQALYHLSHAPVQ
jgi:hypothetical protein